MECIEEDSRNTGWKEKMSQGRKERVQDASKEERATAAGFLNL